MVRQKHNPDMRSRIPITTTWNWPHTIAGDNTNTLPITSTTNEVESTTTHFPRSNQGAQQVKSRVIPGRITTYHE
jgi:hypothetical protein